MAEYLANIDDMDDDNDDIVDVDDSQMDTGRGGRQRGRKRNREDQTWSNYVPPEEAALSLQIHTSDNPGWRAVPSEEQQRLQRWNEIEQRPAYSALKNNVTMTDAGSARTAGFGSPFYGPSANGQAAWAQPPEQQQQQLPFGGHNM